jgi:hypothetical protein
MASIRSPPTFPFNITATCILYGGGPKPFPTAQSGNGSYMQLWYSCIVASPPENKSFDAVTADECFTAITFWEQDPSRRPVEGCVAVVIGESAFVPREPEELGASSIMLKVRGLQVLV